MAKINVNLLPDELKPEVYLVVDAALATIEHPDWPRIQRALERGENWFQTVLDMTEGMLPGGHVSNPFLRLRDWWHDATIVGRLDRVAYRDVLESARKAREQFVMWPVEDVGKKPEITVVKPDGTHSVDYASFWWGGKLYTFNAAQSRVVRCLHENFMVGTPDVLEETLCSVVDSEAPPARISDTFRRHPAWGVAIVPGAKGTRRLF